MSITSLGNTPHVDGVNRFHNDRDLLRVAASPTASSKMQIQSEEESRS
jgi:hypothetical protein